jgi:hypothetical protein
MAIDDYGPQPGGLIEQASRNGDLRVCPTRIDRAPVLFAHKVAATQCQDRQRGHYHKCFTCSWNNAWIELHGPPRAETVERRAFTRTG